MMGLDPLRCLAGCHEASSCPPSSTAVNIHEPVSDGVQALKRNETFEVSVTEWVETRSSIDF